MRTILPASLVAAVLALGGCERGLSACENATKDALEQLDGYVRIAAVEEPGETPAMTYYVIDYMATDASGGQVRERVHCAYWRDTGQAEPRRIEPD